MTLQKKKLAVDGFSGCKSVITTEYNGQTIQKKKELYVSEEQFEKIKKIIFEFAVTVSFCELKDDKSMDFNYYWEAVEYVNYLRKNGNLVYIKQNNTTKVMVSQSTIDNELIDEQYNRTFQKTKKI